MNLALRLLPAALVLCSLSTASAADRELNIHEAIYGRDGADRTCDAKKPIKEVCDGVSICSFPVNDYLCGDPDVGIVKILRIQFDCGSDVRKAAGAEGSVLTLACW